MSRELLKRALYALQELRKTYEQALYKANFRNIKVGPGEIEQEIEEYLAQPEPEPVAMVNGAFGGFTTVMPLVSYLIPVNTPLYTSPPDQSARVAELEKDNAITHENLAWYITKYREHLTEIEVLKQQLAALQAKQEPLSDEDLTRIWTKVNGQIGETINRFARAIESAHVITGEQE